MPSRTIVVTGFGPFAGFDNNPSSALLEPLAEKGIPDFDGELVTQQINVEYKHVMENVKKIWEEKDPLMVVHIGAHPVAGTIKLEQQSFRDGYCRYDVIRRVPENNVACTWGKDVLVSDVDCSTIVSKLSPKHQKDGVCVQTSHDPGRYLCGFSYYLSMLKGRALFIHVPDFDEKCTKEVVVEIVRDAIAEAIKGNNQQVNGM